MTVKSSYPYPFTPKSITIQGHTLSYIDEGSGPAVVMLHGNPTWSFYYRNLARLLQQGFRVIVPDHLGCGLSDKPQDYPYRLADHIANLEQLLSSLRLERLALVMHDWGGAIGMGYAGRHPEKIGSLVVSNTAAFLSPRIPLRIRVCRWPLLGPLLVRGGNLFVRAALKMAVVKAMAPEVEQGYLAPYDSWRNRVAVSRFIQDIPLSPRDPSWPVLQEIEASLERCRHLPMLILWGGRDFCFNDHFFTEWRRRFPQAAYRYFPDAGHYLLEDAFAEAGPMIAEFISRTLAPDT